MTVKQLMEKLQTMPPDADVLTPDLLEVQHVVLNQHGDTSSVILDDWEDEEG